MGMFRAKRLQQRIERRNRFLFFARYMYFRESSDVNQIKLNYDKIQLELPGSLARQCNRPLLQ